MLLNNPMCDYLTLTTFTKNMSLSLLFANATQNTKTKKHKMESYTGLTGNNTFYGQRTQNNKTHYMMRCWGEFATDMLMMSDNLLVKCTRIDLQITIPITPAYNSRSLYDHLSNKEREWKWRRKNVSIIQSGDGLDTIYIGSRSSDRFYRIYVKPDSSGKPAYIRFEVEFKKEFAAAIREAVLKGRAGFRDLLRAELETLPIGNNFVLRSFEAALGVKMTSISPVRVETRSSTIDWMNNQVDPAVVRMLNSHEHRDTMREILDRWLGYSTKPE